MARLPILIAIVFLLGCASHPHGVVPTTAPAPLLSDPVLNRDVEAYVDPPVGWHADPLKSTPKHKHQVWLSPSGHTAYGVIRFSLPLPVGNDLALWGFLDQMKKSEGEATLVSKQWDKNLNALRFVANGGLYCVRVNLFVDGFTGWAVYAGTLRKSPLDADDLKLAEMARENTAVGLRDADKNRDGKSQKRR